MKIKKLILENFGKFSKFALEFGDKVTHLIGMNGAGKSTVGCTAIWAGLKGISETSRSGQLIGERFRFIGDNKKSADIEIHLLDEKTGETIICKNHMTKDTNSITFTSSTNRQLTDEWINSLFSVVFMSAKNFCALSAKDQALKLGIDTAEFDKKIKELKGEYTIINRQLKDMGTLIEPEKVEPVDVNKLFAEKETIRQKLNNKYLENVEHNKKLRAAYNSDAEKEREENRKFNEEQVRLTYLRNDASDHIAAIRNLGYTGEELTVWFKSLTLPQPQKLDIKTKEPEYIQEKPDDSELVAIDNQIASATETNKKADAYSKYLADKAKKDAKQKELQDNVVKQEAEEKKRLDFISSFKFGFSGLSVDDEGGLLLSGRPIKEPYFSKGELEMIVARIASSINSEWTTRFIDDFELLDDENQEKLMKELIEAGYQVITAEVGKAANKDGSIVLKECRIDTGEVVQTKALI